MRFNRCSGSIVLIDQRAQSIQLAGNIWQLIFFAFLHLVADCDRPVGLGLNIANLAVQHVDLRRIQNAGLVSFLAGFHAGFTGIDNAVSTCIDRAKCFSNEDGEARKDEKVE